MPRRLWERAAIATTVPYTVSGIPALGYPGARASGRAGEAREVDQSPRGEPTSENRTGGVPAPMADGVVRACGRMHACHLRWGSTRNEGTP